MAMGGGSGVPEQEDSVLFRRGTGQVRSWTASPSDRLTGLAPSVPLGASASGLARSGSLTAGRYSTGFYGFPHLGVLATGSFLVRLGHPDGLELIPYLNLILPWFVHCF